jgi:hypothetical protein
MRLTASWVTSSSALQLRRRRCYLVRHGHVDYFDASGRRREGQRVPQIAPQVGQAAAQKHHRLLYPLGVPRHCLAGTRGFAKSVPAD